MAFGRLLLALPLEGKIAIVTGSSRGIGNALALRLAHDCAEVGVCARSPTRGELPGTIGETAAEVEALGHRALALKVDLAYAGELGAHNAAIVSVSPGLVIASAVSAICRDGMQYTGRVLSARELVTT